MAEFTNREKLRRPSFGVLPSPESLGRLFREERKRQGLTLKDLYAVSGLSLRFLSEFERGKPNVSLSRVLLALQTLGLELLLLPREEAARLLREGTLRDVDQGGLAP